MKHFFNGGQYNNCQPPGWLAHGLLYGSLHGGGTTADSIGCSQIPNNVTNNHNDEIFITNMKTTENQLKIKFHFIKSKYKISFDLDGY